jgi:hypothetical protein
MLGFTHLFAGAVIGLLLMALFRDRMVVVVCCIGAMLPDILDKPLGHLVLASSLDNGRIYAHSLLFLALLFIVGGLIWKSRGSILVLILGVGVISHLYLDTIWELPTTVFYPLLGPFIPGHFPDYFGNSLIEEVSMPLEWLFALLLIWIFLTLFRQELGAFNKITDLLERLSPLLLLVTAALGLIYLVEGILNPSEMAGFGLSPEGNIVLGLVAVIGCSILFRLRPLTAVRSDRLEERSGVSD